MGPGGYGEGEFRVAGRALVMVSSKRGPILHICIYILIYIYIYIYTYVYK
jgi:hypothetical protein